MTRSKTSLLGLSHLAETIAAVDGFVTAGLERDFGGFAALCAGSGVHLACTASIPFGLP